MSHSKKTIMSAVLAAAMALSSSLTTAALPGENAAQNADGASETAAQSSNAADNSSAGESASASKDELKNEILGELLSEKLPQRMSGAVSTVSTTKKKTISVSSQQTAVSGSDAAAATDKSEKTETPALTHPVGKTYEELYPDYPAGGLILQEPDDSIPLIKTQSDYFAAKYGESSRNKPRAVVLPDKVDNSQSPYFPAIGDQDSLGSCACFAGVYYQFTYTYNKAHNIVTTPENTFSPQFTYNFLNGGEAMGGSNFGEIYASLKNTGASTLSEVPYHQNPKSWPTEEGIYRKAAERRVLENVSYDVYMDEDSYVTSPDDEDLLPIKTALANGEILAYGTTIQSWVGTNLKAYSTDPSINDGLVGQEAVISCDGDKGGHGMTLVGYDDNIWIDINGNDVPDEGEFGAFKIANSWKDTYANSGYTWIAYDAMNLKSQVQGAYNAENRKCIFNEMYGISVRTNYEPRYFVKYTVNTADRYNFRIYVNAEWANTEFSENITPCNFSDKLRLAYDGTTNSTDATLVYDLGDLMEKLGTDHFDEISWSFKASALGSNGTSFKVKNVEFYDEKNAAAHYTPPSGVPFEISSGENTVEVRKADPNIAIIYYYGYTSPLISYKLSGSSASKNDQPMTSSIEAEGYDSKYIISLGSSEYADVSFSDANGHKDDNNGSMYRARKGINKFYTEGAGIPLTSTFEYRFKGEADINTYQQVTANPAGGCIPYRMKLQVYDRDTNELVEDCDYGKSFCPNEYSDSGYYSYYMQKAGNFRLKAIITDARGQSVSENCDLTIKNLPFGYSKFEITNTEETFQTGKELNFEAVTVNDDLRPGGHYNDFAIFRDGLRVYSIHIPSADYNIAGKTSTIKVSFTPELGGRYTAIISRTTLANKYNFAKLEFDVKAPELTISEFSISPEDNIHAGEALNATLIVSGASRDRTSTITIYKNGVPITEPERFNGTINMPCETGPCTIVADVKDNIYGTSARAEKKVWINSVRITDIIADSDTLYTKKPITLGAELNCSDDTACRYTFAYDIFRADGTKVTNTISSDREVSFTPDKAGDYKVKLSLKDDDDIFAVKSRTITVEENPDPQPEGYLITVAVISYIENEGKQSDYRVHYWNGSASGDTELTATGETIKASVGSSYWSGAEKTFIVYQTVIPEEATGFKFHIGDRWFGSDGNVSTSNGVYIFNYSGDKAKYATF